MLLFITRHFFKGWKFCHSLSCCVENPSVCCSASLPHSPSWHRAGRGRWALGLYDVLIKLTNKLVETKLKQRLISELINYVKKKNPSWKCHTAARLLRFSDVSLRRPHNFPTNSNYFIQCAAAHSSLRTSGRPVIRLEMMRAHLPPAGAPSELIAIASTGRIH